MENQKIPPHQKNRIHQIDDLHRRYTGPVPKDALRQSEFSNVIARLKWQRFWRGQVLHAVYALRRHRATRYQQQTKRQFQQWRNGVIHRQHNLKKALRHYRHAQRNISGITNNVSASHTMASHTNTRNGDQADNIKG